LYTITLPSFEGPLDLLLRLIERAELDITTIALASVADQYLVHVRALPSPDPRSLAEFVSMAARLLLIKSRALLPRPEAASEAISADPDAEALARQLRVYQRFQQAAALLREWQEEGRRTFLRTAPVVAPAEPQQLVLNHSVAELISAVQRRIQLALPLEPTLPLSLAPRLTVRQVGERIRQRLVHSGWFSFENLLEAVNTRQELIVTFWAVLELLKRRAIVIEQEALFGPISIGRGSALDNPQAWISDDTDGQRAYERSESV
jgi:segregation and condensation protein A